MYCPRHFAVDDIAVLHDVIRARAFATLAAVVDGAVRFAYAPMVLDAGGLGVLRFHLARANPLAALPQGARLRVSFLAADAYVSPDWYETEGMVPTWNYIAVEGEGCVTRLAGDELRALLAELSAQEEARLLPKVPWLVDKVPAAKMATLLGAIVGYAMPLESLEGKFKLSQNVGPQDFAGVLGGLERRGDAASAAVARAMRTAR